MQSLHSLPTLLGSLVAFDRNQFLPLVQFLRIKSMSLQLRAAIISMRSNVWPNSLPIELLQQSHP
jgi:hypothetical protein